MALSSALPKTIFLFSSLFQGHPFRQSTFLEKANSRAKQLDHYAMQWLFTGDDFSDDSMDTFLEALPGYIHSVHFTDKECLDD
jgi:hypothetical protein